MKNFRLILFILLSAISLPFAIFFVMQAFGQLMTSEVIRFFMGPVAPNGQGQPQAKSKLIRP